MKKGDRVICKSDNRHGVIIGDKWYYLLQDYLVLFDGDGYSKNVSMGDLKLETSLWQRIINKFKNK